MLKITIPPIREPEHRYALDVVCSQWLGLPIIVEVDSAPTPLIRITADGKRLTLPSLFLTRSNKDWLRPASLPAACCPMVTREDDPLLKAASLTGPIPLFSFCEWPGPLFDAERSHLALDVPGAAFFFLTRYEEAVINERDANGNFPVEYSVICGSQMVETPILDAYVELLRTALKRVWPRLETRSTEYRVDVTHDVDWPLSIHRPPLEAARTIAYELKRGRLG